jgi:predicted DNA-binding transcriptional regulator YafY
MANQGWDIRWDILLRYRMIEIIALWEGRLTTNHLQSAFGIGRQQASRDINSYLRDYAADNLVYDRGLKGYRPADTFKPVFTQGLADEYLQMLNANGEFGATFASLSGAGGLTETIQPLNRDLRPEVLRPILQAAREGKRVEICYSSLRNPEPDYRVIQPHTIVFTGVRWHVRAFCERKMDYSDFVLSRISDHPEITLKGENGATGDIAWQTPVTVEIAPDDRLDDNQKQMIERDYGMTGGRLTVATRGALVSYVLQQLRIEHEAADTPPEIQQITLVNRDALSQWLFNSNQYKKNSSDT